MNFLFIIVLFALFISPYLLLRRFIRTAQTPALKISAFLAVLAAYPLGFMAYVDSMLLRPDPQGGLVFLVFPPVLLAVISLIYFCDFVAQIIDATFVQK